MAYTHILTRFFNSNYALGFLTVCPKRLIREGIKTQENRTCYRKIRGYFRE